MPDSDPLATDFYSFMEMLGHRTGMVSDVSFKAGSEDISEQQVGHFKKWIRLFRTNVSLNQGSGPIQKRLQGLMFWASLRLFLHFKDGVAGDFANWNRPYYQEQGMNLGVENDISPQRTKALIRKARSLEINPGGEASFGAWQLPFEQIGKARSPAGAVKIGDYVQASLGLQKNGNMTAGFQIAEGDEGKKIELRCRLTTDRLHEPEMYPLSCVVTVQDIEDNASGLKIWGEILLDEDENPLESRSHPDVIIEGVKEFTKEMAKLIREEENFVFSSTEADEFYRSRTLNFWPEGFLSNDLEEMLKWICGKQYPSHLESIAEFSQKYDGIPSIYYHPLGYFGTDKKELSNFLKKKKPEYQMYEDSRFIHSRLGRCPGAFLPASPHNFHLYIETICSAAQVGNSKEGPIAEQWGGEEPDRLASMRKTLRSLTYRDLGGRLDRAFSEGARKKRRHMALMYRLCFYSKKGSKRRQQIDDIIQWDNIPTDPFALCDQLEHSYIENIMHKIEQDGVEFPRKWEQILQAYFKEVAEWLGDGPN